MLLPIYIYGSAVLRKESEDIAKDYPELDKFLENLWETMYEADGVGLAAPQVGRNIRIFVVDASVNADKDPSLAGFKKAFINAHIYERSGDAVPMFEPAGNQRTGRKAVADQDPLRGRKFRRARRGVRRFRGAGHPARVRPPGRQTVHRPRVAAAPNSAEKQTGRDDQREIQSALSLQTGEKIVSARSRDLFQGRSPFRASGLFAYRLSPSLSAMTANRLIE